MGSDASRRNFAQNPVDAPSERTPLLASGSIVPTNDSAIAESTAADQSPNTSSTSVHSETSSTVTITAPENSSDEQDEDKPLPVTQILLLCFARVCEPIAFFSIFPFINQMCVRNGNIQPADTGFYSGLIESLFSLTQMLSMIGWGRVSDRFGRKPVLCISLLGVGLFGALFGFAQSIWQMIIFRCLAGVFSGTIVTIRTMIGEHSTQKTQARAYSWFAVSGNLGILIGPLIGGSLADPAKQYGGSFEHIKFFREYPYAMATTATGLVALIAAGVAAVSVEETLPGPRVVEVPVLSAPEAEPLLEEALPKLADDTGIWSVIRAPGVVPVLYLTAHIYVLAFAYTAVGPVFWYEPIELGGLGFSSLWISIFMALTGAAQAIWLLLIFPPLQHRIGTGGVLRWCAYLYPLFFLIPPSLNAILRQGSHASEVIFWIAAPILLCVGVGISMCFTAIQLALNDVNPNPRTLGTLNALGLTITSAMRAICPAAFNSLYAVGVGKQILAGYLAWVVMIVIAAGLAVGVAWLPPNAEGKPAKGQDKKRKTTSSQNPEDRD